MRSPKAKVEAGTANLGRLPGGGGISFGPIPRPASSQPAPDSPVELFLALTFWLMIFRVDVFWDIPSSHRLAS